MAEYYIDSLCGSNDGDGSKCAPLLSHRSLNLLPGDTVLFRRGGEYRDGIYSPDGEEGKPICFRAYGDGEAPRFYGSKNCSDSYLWKEVSPRVWRLLIAPESEVCNVVFDFGKSCGVLAWTLSSLDRQGKWFYEAYGCKDSPKPGASLLLYSECNPAVYYGDIELALYGKRRLASGRHHVRFEGLHFLCSGVHGYAETSPCDVEITDCIFDFIGGCVWSAERKIRFGNAIEFWNGAKDCKIDDCEFVEIYDSCFTTQGNGKSCGDFENIAVTGSTFCNYGMAAYELRDKIGKNVRFEFNLCDGAGGGFSIQDETPPRNSEIYPEPMGHHIFAWRIDEPTDGGSVRIMSNLFRGTPLGKTFYSRISPSALAQIETDAV